jgi:hypothetical protein
MSARVQWVYLAQPLLFLVGVVLSTTVNAGARQLSIDELAVNAKVVAVGKIVAVASSWNTERTQIFTQVELQPEEMLKGVPAGDDRISFVQLGGRVGNLGSAAAETPSFTEGERVVLFLVPRRNGQLGVMAFFEGKFSIERDPSTGVDIAVRRAPSSGQVLDRVTLETLRLRVLAALGK